MARAHASRTAGIVALVLALGVIVAALLLPWFFIDSSGGGSSTTVTFYPGVPSSNGTVRSTCTGTGASCLSQTSYASADLNNTGVIAETGFVGLLIAGLCSGLAALTGGLASGSDRRASLATVLAVLAVVLSIAAPSLFAFELPSAVGKDIPSHMGSGPWNSFFGSNSSGSGASRSTVTWGAGLGWYLAIIAFAGNFIGMVLLAGSRREGDPPQSRPPPQETSPDPYGSPESVPASEGRPPGG
jgi:hypothetical protein